MAKKKAKAGKLPKEVLGVKVPKEWRKAGERLIEQAQGPAGRQAIAGALTAVAGAVATAALSREAAKAGGADRAGDTGAAGAGKAEPGPRSGAEHGPEAGPEPGEAFARAAEALVGKLFVRRS